MAERLTRGEHMAEAERLTAEADRLARQMVRGLTWELAPVVRSLAALAQTHRDLAGREHEYATAEEFAPLWVRHSEGRYSREPGWALILFDEPSPGHEDVGWYAYGPGFSGRGYWTCPDLAAAKAMTNRLIDAYHANPGSKP